MIVLAIILVLVLVIIITNLCVVQQAQAYVIERLGAYSTTWGKGLHVKLPFIERVARRVSLKEQVADFPPQPVITKDNVTMQIDTVVYFQITDPKLYTYGIEQPMVAIETLSATTLRNIIGCPQPAYTGTSTPSHWHTFLALICVFSSVWLPATTVIPNRSILSLFAASVIATASSCPGSQSRIIFVFSI